MMFESGSYQRLVAYRISAVVVMHRSIHRVVPYRVLPIGNHSASRPLVPIRVDSIDQIRNQRDFSMSGTTMCM
jgi:hypothetical protein